MQTITTATQLVEMQQELLRVRTTKRCSFFQEQAIAMAHKQLHLVHLDKPGHLM